MCKSCLINILQIELLMNARKDAFDMNKAFQSFLILLNRRIINFIFIHIGFKLQFIHFQSILYK
jgi:hypothetical protein